VRPIDPSEILDLVAYERVREEFVRRIVAHKKPRRLAVGHRLTFVFEDRETVRFQIQEMTRAERTVDPAQIATEVRIYNELIPGPGELSATLMIEIPEAKRIRAELDRLVGIDERVFLDVGERSVQASFDPKQFESDRISAVQYVRFPLGEDLTKLFCDPEVPATLRVDHPHYRESAAIKGATRASLGADLAAE